MSLNKASNTKKSKPTICTPNLLKLSKKWPSTANASKNNKRYQSMYHGPNKTQALNQIFGDKLKKKSNIMLMNSSHANSRAKLQIFDDFNDEFKENINPNGSNLYQTNIRDHTKGHYTSSSSSHVEKYKDNIDHRHIRSSQTKAMINDNINLTGIYGANNSNNGNANGNSTEILSKSNYINSPNIHGNNRGSHLVLKSIEVCDNHHLLGESIFRNSANSCPNYKGITKGNNQTFLENNASLVYNSDNIKNHDSNIIYNVNRRKSQVSLDREDNDLQIDSKETCINHPYKKGKYHKVRSSGEDQRLSPSKYCSKCAISLTEKGLKMKEIILLDPSLRKHEIDKLLGNISMTKSNIIQAIEAFNSRKDDIITYYLKQTQRAEWIYNTINKIIMEERIKSTDIINKNKEDVLEQIKKHYKQCMDLQQQIVDIQSEIENNYDYIIKNKESFQEILSRYIEKINGCDEFLETIKTNTIVLTKLSPLKKSIVDNLKPLITSLYETIKLTTSLLKNNSPNGLCDTCDNSVNGGNISGTNGAYYHSARHSRKHSSDGIYNLNKSSLYISFDNKDIFENAMNNTRDDQIGPFHNRRCSRLYSNKSSSDNLSLLVNRSKEINALNANNSTCRLTMINESKKQDDLKRYIQGLESQEIKNYSIGNGNDLLKGKLINQMNNNNNNHGMKRRQNLRDALTLNSSKFDQLLRYKFYKSQISERAKSFIHGQNNDNHLQHSSNHKCLSMIHHQYDHLPGSCTNRRNFVSAFDIDNIDNKCDENYGEIDSMNCILQDQDNPNIRYDNQQELDRKSGLDCQNQKKYINLLNKVKANQSRKSAYYMWLLQNNPNLTSMLSEKNNHHENRTDNKPKSMTCIREVDKCLTFNQNNQITTSSDLNEKLVPKRCKQSRISSSAEVYTPIRKPIKTNLSLDDKIDCLDHNNKLRYYKTIIESNSKQKCDNQITYMKNSSTAKKKKVFSPNFKYNLPTQKVLK